jgi:hypothetical protein
MDVVINELTSTVEMASDDGLLDPAVLGRLVEEVRERLREDEATRRWEERERHPGAGR